MTLTDIFIVNLLYQNYSYVKINFVKNIDLKKI